MREVCNDPCEHMVETAMADFFKLFVRAQRKQKFFDG